MLAVEAPFKKLVAVGGVALLIATGFALRHRGHHHHHHARHRLTLHAPVEPGATYFTIFADGDLIVSELPEGSSPLHWSARIETPDSCYWRVTESMTPTDARHFDYAYTEESLGCEPDAIPSWIPTPRTGQVVVDE